MTVPVTGPQDTAIRPNDCTEPWLEPAAQAAWALNATWTGATAVPSRTRHVQGTGHETARRGPELPAWEAEPKATEQLSAWQAGGSKEQGAYG